MATDTLDRERIHTVIAGKAIERGLEVEDLGESVIIHTDSPEKDSLHRQIIRSLVKRVAPDATVRTMSTDDGFMVRVERTVKQPKTEEPARKEPEAEQDNDEDRLASLLERVLKKIAS